MPNEFKIKKGFLAEGNSQITGSLTVTDGITGSLQGTATNADNATNAGYATNAGLASDASGISSAISNNGDNYLLTATSMGTIEGESSLTFDGTTLTLGGSFSQAGGAANGSDSHVEGSKNNRADGEGSHAEGDITTSVGRYSHAEGYTTIANADYSHTEGDTTYAGGTGAHAEGAETVAGINQGYLVTSIASGICTLDRPYDDISGYYVPGDTVLFSDRDFDNIYGIRLFTVDTSTYVSPATLIGLLDENSNPIMSGTGAVIGRPITQSVADWAGGNPIGGDYSHAEGYRNQTLGYGSHAEGWQAFALGQYSHAEGFYTQAIGDNSHAEGDQTKAEEYASHAEGYGTYASGVYSHAEGQSAKSYGTGSHAEGYGTLASGSYSHAEGTSTNSRGQGSHAEGFVATANGDFSHAEGVGTQATGVASHAEGKETVAAGSGSHAEGDRTKAGGGFGYLTSGVSAGTCSLDASYGNVTSSFSVGTMVVLDDTGYSGTYGVRILTVATVGLGTPTGPTMLSFTDVSINTTTAIIGNLGSNLTTGDYPVGGNYSHAEGGATRALGGYSHAEGIGTWALGAGQHVSGRNNTLTDSTSLFIVGNGVDGANRSDAFKVRQSGSIVLPTTVSSTPTWTGTQGEMVFGDNGAVYKLFVWLNGGWRSTPLT